MTHRTRKKTGEGGFMRDVDVIAHLMKIQGWMMRIETRLQGRHDSQVEMAVLNQMGTWDRVENLASSRPNWDPETPKR